jgi:type II secretory pathway component PulF
MKNPFPTFGALLARLRELPSPRDRRLRFDPLLFLHELASMLRSGISVHQALAFSAEGFRPRVRRRIDSVRERVEAGLPLSEALETLPDRWIPRVLIASVAAGEKTGRLPDLLDEVTREYERIVLIDRRIRSTLVYPLAVLTFGLLVLMVLVEHELPTFAAIYHAAGQPPPFLSEIVRSIWYTAGIPLLVLVPALLSYLLLTLGRPFRFSKLRPIGRFLAGWIPIVRGLHSALLEVRFARTLRVLLDGGVPFPEALELCEPVVADRSAGRAIVAAASRIRDGAAPSQALAGLPFLSPSYLWFLSGSEGRGDFIEITRAMADAANERFCTRIEIAERVIEPASVVVLGLVLGTATIAMYQPLFGLSRLAGH